VEPTGYIGEESVNNFYALVAAEETTEVVKRVVQHFLQAASALAVRVSTYAGPRTYRLGALIAWVKASKNYGVDLHNAIPLVYRPWPGQLARDLYKLASPRLRRLAVLHGFVKAVRINRSEVKGLLKNITRSSLWARCLRSIRGRPRALPHPMKGLWQISQMR